MHSPKQNSRYCWLYKIWTGNDCSVKHYKMTLIILHLMKWPESCWQKKNANFGQHNLISGQNTTDLKIQSINYLVMCSHFLPLPALLVHSNLMKRMTSCVTWNSSSLFYQMLSPKQKTKQNKAPPPPPPGSINFQYLQIYIYLLFLINFLPIFHLKS